MLRKKKQPLTDAEQLALDFEIGAAQIAQHNSYLYVELIEALGVVRLEAAALLGEEHLITKRIEDMYHGDFAWMENGEAD